MAVVIKNTFLDVAEHKFLYFDGPSPASRRCQSVPHNFKPTTTSTPGGQASTRSPFSSPPASPRSNYSFFSAVGSSSATGEVDGLPASRVVDSCQSQAGSVSPPLKASEQHSKSPEATDTTSSAWEDAEADAAAGPSMPFCTTPTSSVGSPRACMGHSFSQRCFCEESGANCDETDRVLCFLTSCHCGLGSPVVDVAPVHHTQKIVDGEDQRGYIGRRSEEQEPENEPDTCAECAPDRTRLKIEAAPFQPVPVDTRMDAVVNAVYLLLVSCGQIRQIKVEQGLTGTSPTLICAELQSGPQASARCYDVMQLAKQTLSSITTHLPTILLLSARVQKEDSGYSLRSSVACVPESSQANMCWDMFRKGNCPRRSLCRWYHPQNCDIGKVKVVIKFAEEMDRVSSEEELVAGLPAGRHQISLGELVQ